MRTITLDGGGDLQPQTIVVPGDPSSATFPIVAALIVEGSEVTVENALLNPTRTGLVQTLLEMGADVSIENRRTVSGEEVGDIRVRASGLKGISVPPDRAPSMIDEYPVLAVAAAFAEGETRMEGIAELRVKESDRITTMVAGLKANGVSVEEGTDWMVVKGGGGAPAGGATVTTSLDHRHRHELHGARPGDEGTGDHRRCAATIATSFPDFRDMMTGLGARFEDVEPG